MTISDELAEKLDLHLEPWDAAVASTIELLSDEDDGSEFAMAMLDCIMVLTADFFSSPPMSDEEINLVTEKFRNALLDARDVSAEEMETRQ